MKGEGGGLKMTEGGIFSQKESIIGNGQTKTTTAHQNREIDDDGDNNQNNNNGGTVVIRKAYWRDGEGESPISISPPSPVLQNLSDPSPSKFVIPSLEEKKKEKHNRNCRHQNKQVKQN